MNKILYEDDQLMVVYKPAGLATQTKSLREKDLVDELKSHLGGNVYLGVVHRLDQPVEGLLVFAKTAQMARELTRQLGDSVLNKSYLAVVYLEQEDRDNAGILEDFLIKDGRTNTSRIGTKDEPDAKYARLNYEIQKKIGKRALVKIEIHTGRHHQIRVQMAAAGRPLLGDSRYGSEASREESARWGVRNVALCADRITFRHPVTRKQMEFSIVPEQEIYQKF